MLLWKGRFCCRCCCWDENQSSYRERIRVYQDRPVLPRRKPVRLTHQSSSLFYDISKGVMSRESRIWPVVHRVNNVRTEDRRIMRPTDSVRPSFRPSIFTLPHPHLLCSLCLESRVLSIQIQIQIHPIPCHRIGQSDHRTVLLRLCVYWFGGCLAGFLSGSCLAYWKNKERNKQAARKAITNESRCQTLRGRDSPP